MVLGFAVERVVVVLMFVFADCLSIISVLFTFLCVCCLLCFVV